MSNVPHELNWMVGWWLILSALLTGAGMGLFFHHEDFLGGYVSFPRRLLRLGHIALAALGIINVLYGLSPLPAPGNWRASVASAGFVVGGLSMPSICFLTAWKRLFRHLFAFPVFFLILAVVCTLEGGRL